MKFFCLNSTLLLLNPILIRELQSISLKKKFVDITPTVQCTKNKPVHK